MLNQPILPKEPPARNCAFGRTPRTFLVCALAIRMEHESVSSAAPAFEIVAVTGPPRLSAIRELFQEYADSLEIDLCFQHFTEELAGLPGKYAPPQGRLYLALAGAQPAGCVALRPLAPEVGELKRLYVRPAFRRSGMGRRLAVTALDAAREIGYQTLRLDTLATMKEAITLYESLGFRHTKAYCDNPSPHAVFMEMALHASLAGNRLARGQEF